MEEGWHDGDSGAGPVGGDAGRSPGPSPGRRSRPGPRRAARPSPPLPLAPRFASKAPDALALPPHFHSPRPPASGSGPVPPAAARRAMDAKAVVVLALVLTALCLGDGECAGRRGGAGRAGAPLPAPSPPAANSICAAWPGATQPILRGARSWYDVESPARSAAQLRLCSPQLDTRSGATERPPHLERAARRYLAG